MDPVKITIDLNTHPGTLDCNLCEWASGEYYLAPCQGTEPPGGDDCGDPNHRWTSPAGVIGVGSCRWGYASSYGAINFMPSDDLICSVTGTTINDFKQITAGASLYVDARSYCAYMLDGVLYDMEVSGSKLVGRALEVRLKLAIQLYHWGYGGCGFVKDPSMTREEANALGCAELYSNSIAYPNLYGLMIPGITYGESYESCCLYDRYPDPYPLGDCESLGLYDWYSNGVGYADLVFLWRTINSTNHECLGALETLRFVPEESYSFRYYETNDVCAKHDLCDSTGVVTWETS